MKYKKNQYSEGTSLCAVIIGVGLIYWGITGFNIWFVSLFFIIAGISIIVSQIRAITNRGQLRKAVKYEYEYNPDASVELISRNLNITKKDVQAITLDLKARGELRGIFSTTTGKIEIVQEDAPEEVKAQFCPNCGTPIREGSAMFCAYCGSPFQETPLTN